ncbi:MAG: hypothetical protein ACO3PB_04605 [Miltoncostaeaceae bacterium]
MRVRGLTATEEARLLPHLEDALRDPAASAGSRLWLDLAIDLAVGLESATYVDPDGGALGTEGEPIAARLTAVAAMQAPDAPVPVLHFADVVSAIHREQVAPMLVQMWLGRHAMRMTWEQMQAEAPPAGRSTTGIAVPTCIGLLWAEPLALQSAGPAWPQMHAALIAPYLLAGHPVERDDMAPPDLDVMAGHCAQAVTHRWSATDGAWLPFRLTTDPEGQGDAWTGAITPICLVRLHEVAARYVVAASDFLAPWGRLGPTIAGMWQAPPFLEDVPEYDGLPGPARVMARAGWATMWAMEHAKRVSSHLPGL